MKTLNQILSEPIRYNDENKYREIISETYRGINRNLFMNDDVNEAVNTAAGIDTYKTLKLIDF